MALNVVVPVRLRLDPEACRSDPQALREAVAAAAARGLAQAREKVFAPRGGYALPRFLPPTMSIGGAGAGLLDGAEREWLVGLVAQGLDDATRELQLALARGGDDPPEPLRAGEAAVFDPSRELLGGLGYLVDSYQSRDRRPGAQAVGKAAGAAGEAPRRTRHQIVLAACAPNAPDLLDCGHGYLASVVQAAFAGDFAGPNLLGVFFRNTAAGGESWLGILRVQLVGGRLVWDQGRTYAQRAIFSTTWMDEGRAQRTSALASGLVQQWKRVGTPSLANIDAVAEVLGKAMDEGRFLDAQLEALRQRRKRTSAQQAVIDRFERLGREAWYRRAARQRIDPRGTGPAPYRLYQINEDNGFFLFPAELDLEFASLRVVPLIEDRVVEHARRRQARAGTGGEPARARGGAGDGGGDARGGEPRPPGPGGGVSGGEHGQGDCSAYCFERPQTGQLAFGGAPPCELITGPFECEPEVSVFGDLGRRMAALIEEIARALRMDSRAWPHAGAFAINAARMLRARAVLAARADPGKVQDARPAAMGTGNLGGLHAVIAISPGIAQLRSLGAVAKQVEQLDDLVLAALGPSSTFLSDCGKQQFGARWALHYLKEYTPAAESAGYEIFVQACRVAMLQLLAASRQGIEWMQSQFETFYAGIEGLMLGPTKRLVELWRLREQILQAELYDFVVGVDDGVKTTPGADPKAPRRGLWDATKAGAEASVRVGYQAWRDARDWWAHDDTLGHARTELAARGRIAGTVERQADGTFAVRETRGGEERLWTLAELDGAIAFTRQTVVTVNPIVKHMTNLEGSAAAFANGPQATKAFVRRTVDRMLQANKEATAAVREDAMFAFRTARFSEDWKEPTIAGTGVRLGQIHAMAHEAIGDAFTGSRIYLQGVKFLFGSEQGREALMPMLELAITIGAFVLFAPAGFALSAAFATSRYEDATGHVALTQGLIEPGEVFDHVEAELELFMSHFEIAMLVVPAARPIARRGIAALRTLRQQSLRAGLRTLGRRATAHILEEFALALKGELAHAFVSQLATAKLLEPILQLVLEPVFAVIGSEAELGQKAAGGTPSAEPPGALAARMQLLADYGDVDIDLDPAAPAEDPP